MRLLEREDVLADVAAGIGHAVSGRGAVTFLEAEAGLGKTSVLDAAARQARAAGVDVWRASGERMEGSVPFGLAARTLRGLDPEAGIALEPAAPLHRALRRLEARGNRPVVLALDDLQWADADSLALFAFLARRLGALPVLLVGALRPWPSAAHDLVQELVAGGVATLHRLAPLSLPAVGALLAERSGTVVGPDVVRGAAERCHGNPLLLEQIAPRLARGERLPDAARGESTGEDLLLARFAGFDDDGLAFVRAASVQGTSFRPDVAAAVARLDDAAAERTLEGLARGGLVTVEESGDGLLRFVHPFYAGAVYGDVPGPLRRRLHSRCFEVLAERGLDSEAAAHAVRAELVGDARAAAILETAGRAALAAGAVAGACDHLEAALRVHGDRPPAQLAMAQAEALTAAGRVEEARDACRALLAGDALGWSDRVELLRLLGRALYLVGAADHGGSALEEAAEVAVRNGAPERAVQPLLDLSMASWLAGGPARALPVAARARDLAADADFAVRERAEATWGHLAFEAGDPEGLAVTDRIARRFDPPAGPRLDPAELIWPWTSFYQCAMNENHAERLSDAERRFRQARAVVERAGAANALATLAIYLANNLMRQGRLQEALDEAARAEEFSELTPGVLAYAAAVRAEVLAWSGRGEESEAACAIAETSAPGQWFAELWVAHVRGLRLLWEGSPQASEVLRVAERISNDAGIREPCHLHWAGHAVTAHLAVGRMDDAERVVGHLERCAATLPCRWPRIAAAQGAAEIAAVRGDHQAAEDGFARAIELHREVDLPLLSAETLLAHGGFLRRRARTLEARPRLAEALEVAERTGAGHLAATAREELRLAGGRRRRGTAERDVLTPAEQRVASLAAEGASNAEIAARLHVSVNTVETHLKRVYAKLGIRSRRELIAAGRTARPGASLAAP